MRNSACVAYAQLTMSLEAFVGEPAERGEHAEKGEPLCRIHARTESAADEAAALLGEAFLVG